ncbi:protein SCO2 homolog, mitochondrial-like [Brevipalpus obovatus]|uniref:protein SCO2 homolog, mitochondrial-like n=1 Tax=Brevipalpus obovatus TaxID=246614 RepID=UPI003D9F265D
MIRSAVKRLFPGMTWKSVTIGSVILGSFGAGYVFLEQEKKLMAKKLRLESLRKTIGGAFNLTDHHGQSFGSDKLLGRWVLIYFGFTHCPDICPEELEKITDVINVLDANPSITKVEPLFVSVDPARDTPQAVEKYLKDFHPRLLGLTGSQEDVNKVTQLFRVYSHAAIPDEHNEYIVDHTIITYLINPDGEFVDYYMRSNSVEQIVKSVIAHMKDYEVLKKDSLVSRLLPISS